MLVLTFLIYFKAEIINLFKEEVVDKSKINVNAVEHGLQIFEERLN